MERTLAIKEETKVLKARYQKAILLREKGQPKEALKIFKSIIKKGPYQKLGIIGWDIYQKSFYDRDHTMQDILNSRIADLLKPYPLWKKILRFKILPFLRHKIISPLVFKH